MLPSDGHDGTQSLGMTFDKTLNHPELDDASPAR
jgi:hypothetical protein